MYKSSNLRESNSFTLEARSLNQEDEWVLVNISIIRSYEETKTNSIVLDRHDYAQSGSQSQCASCVITMQCRGAVDEDGTPILWSNQGSHSTQK